MRRYLSVVCDTWFVSHRLFLISNLKPVSLLYRADAVLMFLFYENVFDGLWRDTSVDGFTEMSISTSWTYSL